MNKYLFFILALSSFTSKVHASEPNLYQEKIEEYQLAEDPQWQRLLHYARSPIGVWKSQISQPSFFLSGNGRSDPQAELMATFEALQDPAENHRPNEHPICRFPGRKRFLQQKIGIPDDFFPEARCPLYQSFINRLKAEQISIVFSSYYTNSPGSAFGHTLFKIGQRQGKDKSKDSSTDLLDYGIGYGANVNDINPVTYAIYGIFGGFGGSFTNVPFYYKVREYGDFENRDLWIYDLNLTDLERDLLIDHLWEVGDVEFNYYFFTQNCAYHMLSTLDAAAPRLNLVDNMPLWSIPSDSIKVLFLEKNLVKKVSFRPSLRRTFLSRFEKLDQNEREKFDEYLNQDKKSEFSKLNLNSKMKILDASLDYYDFKYPKEVTNPKSESFKKKNSVLIERAQLGVKSPPLEIIPTETEAPHKGHPSSRISLGGLSRRIEGSESQLISAQFRFALQDILDPVEGYPQWSQLEFGQFKFEYWNQEKNLKLKEFWFFQAMTAEPISKFEKNFSWKGRLGQKSFPGLAELATGSDFGVGASFLISNKYSINWISFMNFEVFYQNQVANDWILGSGPETGFVIRPDPKWAAYLKANYLTYAQKGFANDLRSSAQVRYSLTPKSVSYLEWNRSLFLAPGEKETGFKSLENLNIGIHVYF